jgi:CRISPR-associated endonuclease Csn1
MNYKIGLDIGITSVGWATVNLDSNDEPYKIIDMGVRIFDAAENPKDGASLALPRREARGARRRIRRKKHRLDRIRTLIFSNNLLTEDQFNNLFSHKKLKDIYEIRVEALDRLLNQDEITRLLIHLAQRRGFKSNRKSEKLAEEESGKLLKAVEINKKLMLEKGYRTVGEMLLKDPKFADHKRNKSDDYSHTVGRDLVLEEVQMVFDCQRKYGSEILNDEFESKYVEILFTQRSFDNGPGLPSPYSGDQIEKMIGMCRFEKKEKRAPKAAFSAEYANLLQNINNIRVNINGESRFLTGEERRAINELAFKSPALTYAKIRKELKFTESVLFSTLNYGNKSINDVEKGAKFDYLKNYHKVRVALDKIEKNRIYDYSIEALNGIGYAFTVYKTDQKIADYLNDFNISRKDLEVLLLHVGGFSKFANLSTKALDKIIPFLEQGFKYNVACEKADYNFKGHDGKEKQLLLPAEIDELTEVTSPVVRRAIAQTRKVINSIIRQYGESPTFIGIELAREMAKDFSDRNRIEKEMKENQAQNERIKQEISDQGVLYPSGIDIVKLKLWKQQDGICPYSLKEIQIDRLFEVGYADIDHIIPYSISFNDSYANKVVVLASENRQKGNRLPLHYLKGDKADKFKVWVNNTIRDKNKKMNFLKEDITEEDRKRFKERNLNDTKHVSRFMYNYLNDYLLFAENNTGKKKKVTTVNGAVTSYFRKRWGISKVREDGDLHHAVDALVVACTSDGMIQKVSRHCDYKEKRYVQLDEHVVDKKTGEIIEKFPMPWEGFRNELDIRLMDDPMKFLNSIGEFTEDNIKPIFVSRMPKRKITGAAHKETIFSPKLKDEGLILLKRPLEKLKLDKDGEIENYYNPDSDRRLYQELKEQLEKYDNYGKKAFSEPFYKPTKNGGKGPVVKKVKVYEKASLTVDVHNGKGVAYNDSMIRIDIFHVEGEGYYFIPIYIADRMKKELPNKAVVAHKSYKEWKGMNDKDFIFSLYPNDLIRIEGKKELKLSSVSMKGTLSKEYICKEIHAYYVKSGIKGGVITIINHDNTYTIQSLGIKTLKTLEKYQVDPLGNYYKVGKEKRMPLK